VYPQSLSCRLSYTQEKLSFERVDRREQQVFHVVVSRSRIDIRSKLLKKSVSSSHCHRRAPNSCPSSQSEVRQKGSMASSFVVS
jgi:hypothetical protein